jgi:hypothetical protein
VVQANVLHRDISAHNILFDVTTPEAGPPNPTGNCVPALLIDYDYALSRNREQFSAVPAEPTSSNQSEADAGESSSDVSVEESGLPLRKFVRAARTVSRILFYVNP